MSSIEAGHTVSYGGGVSRKRGFYRSYTPEEVLEGWRNYSATGGQKVKIPKPKSFDRPGESARRPDRDLLMYWHVEGFLLESKVHEAHRSALRAGGDLQASAAFSEWFILRPFRLVEPDELSKLDAAELAPMTLAAAAAAKGLRPRELTEAIREEKLTAWRPNGGRWLTNLMEVERWLEANPRTVNEHGGKRQNSGSGGKRDGAGRKRAA